MQGEKTLAMFPYWDHNARMIVIGRKKLEQFTQRHSDATGQVNPLDYSSDIEVFQLAKDGSVIKGYTLRNAWPSDLSAIDVSYGAENEIERFTCTWQYDYWEATEGVITTGQ